MWDVIVGDNLLLLKDMGDMYDLVVTSPPYDGQRSYTDSFEGWDRCRWEETIRSLYHALKPGGTCVWVVNDATVNGSETGSSFRQAIHAQESGFLGPT